MEIYDGKGDTIHKESGFASRDEAGLDFRSYMMALQSDDLWNNEYLVHFDRLPDAV